jgi:hypothetical protein
VEQELRAIVRGAGRESGVAFDADDPSLAQDQHVPAQLGTSVAGIDRGEAHASGAVVVLQLPDDFGERAFREKPFHPLRLDTVRIRNPNPSRTSTPRTSDPNSGEGDADHRVR